MEEKRTKRLEIRLTKKELKKIEELAFKTGKVKAIFVRESALNKQLYQRLTDKEIDFFVAIKSVTNNLNQITKILHQKGLKKTVEKLEPILNKIIEITKKLN